MRREELLQLASQYPNFALEAIAVARRVTCAEELRSATISLDRQIKKLENRPDNLRVTGVGCMAVALATLVGFPGTDSGTVLLTLIGALVVLCYMIAAATDSLAAAKPRMSLLKPLVDATACTAALGYLELGRPAVQAWRDMAIAERGVLCEFDLLILRDLHYASIKAEDDLQYASIKAEEDAAARRKLYGSSDIASAFAAPAARTARS